MKTLFFTLIIFSISMSANGQIYIDSMHPNPATAGDYFFLKDKRAIKATKENVFNNRLLIKSEGQYYFLDGKKLAEGKKKTQVQMEDKFKLEPNLYLKSAGKIGKISPPKIELTRAMFGWLGIRNKY